MKSYLARLVGAFIALILASGAVHAATSATWGNNGTWGSSANTEAQDFNGDGLIDLASATPLGMRMKFSQGSSFYEETWPAGTHWSPDGFTVSGDFNGDGLPDIASAISGIVYVKLNRGPELKRFDEVAWPVANAWGTANYMFAGDFNGDGKADIASANAGTVHMKLSTGSGFTSVNWPVANTWGSGGFTFAGDFNGDGKADIASANAGTVHMKISTGNGFTSANWPVLNQWGSQGFAAAGDFNNDGKMDIASANAGSIYLKLSTGTGFTTATTWTVANAYGTSGWFFGGDFTGDGFSDIASPNATAVYMKLNEPPVVAGPGVTNNRYYARVGDINGDGYRDLFVTGSAQRFVPDFILQRIPANGSFTLIANPTTAQKQTAQLWPVSNISIFREDLNFDGYFDFYIENIGEAVPGSDDVIVYTRRGVGNTPGKVVSLNQQFRNIEERIYHAITGVSILSEFYAQTCVTSYTPSLVLPPVPYDWLFTGAPDDWYRDRYILIFDGISYSNGSAVPSQTCYVHGNQESPEYKKFIRAAGDWIGLTASACAECYVRARQVLTGNGGWVITTGAVLATSARLARAAWILTAVLVADDATVVGAVDDVLIPVIVLVGVGAELTTQLVRVLNESQPPDAGPTSNPDSSNGSNSFQKPPNYDPNDPNKRPQQNLPPNAHSSSERLGSNLKKMGWDPPANSEAHHIVRQTGSRTDVQVSQNILRRNGVHFDEASNGGWLPESSESASQAGTRATPHSRIHTKAYDAAVRARLEAAESAGGGPGNAGNTVRAELQEILDEILNGTFTF